MQTPDQGKPQYKITATAPTIYQHQSLSKFNLNVKSNGNGSYTGNMIFETEQEAKDYLINRAEMYYDDYEGQAEEHIADIQKHGSLTIDAVTAKIEEVTDIIY